MRLHAPVAFIFAALGSALGSLLAFGAPLASAEATPLSDFARPLTGSVDTASLIAVTVAGLVAMVGVIVYSVVVLRREPQATVVSTDVPSIAPVARETEETRKAA
jgi:hypothetical protein